MSLTEDELRALAPSEPRVEVELAPWFSPLSWQLVFDAADRSVRTTLHAGTGVALGYFDPWSSSDDGRLIRREASTTQRAATWLRCPAGQQALDHLWVLCLASDADATAADDHARRLRRLIHEVQWSSTR